MRAKKNKRVYRCNLCLRWFSTDRGLQAHIRIKHTDPRWTVNAVPKDVLS